MTTFGYPRDASAYDHPNVTSPKKVHRESDSLPGQAACNGAVLVEDAPIRVQLGEPICCRRCWPTP